MLISLSPSSLLLNFFHSHCFTSRSKTTVWPCQVNHWPHLSVNTCRASFSCQLLNLLMTSRDETSDYSLSESSDPSSLLTNTLESGMYFVSNCVDLLMIQFIKTYREIDFSRDFATLSELRAIRENVKCSRFHVYASSSLLSSFSLSPSLCCSSYILLVMIIFSSLFYSLCL